MFYCFFFCEKKRDLLKQRISILSNQMLNNSWSCKTPNCRMLCSPCQLRELVCNSITVSSHVDYLSLWELIAQLQRFF